MKKWPIPILNLILGMIILLSYQNCSSGGFALKTFVVKGDSAVSLSAVNPNLGFTKSQLVGTWQEPCMTSDSITSFQQTDTFDSSGVLTVDVKYFSSNPTCSGDASSTQSETGNYSVLSPNKWDVSTQIQANISGHDFIIGAEITNDHLYFGSSSGDDSPLDSAEPLSRMSTAP